MTRSLNICGGRDAIEATFLKAARATCDFYIRETPTCGIPYWDTGAPGLAKLGDYRDRPADPFNDEEPVDSSAAAIAAQGLLRLGHYLAHDRQAADAAKRMSKPASRCSRHYLMNPIYHRADVTKG